MSIEAVSQLQQTDLDMTSLPDQVKDTVYQLAIHIMGPQLPSYLDGRIYSPNACADPRKQNKWLKKLKAAAIERPDHFTSLRLLDQGKMTWQNYEIDWGSWAKPNMPYTADFVHVWEQYETLFMVVADGAQMIMKANELPNDTFRQVCAAQLKDGNAVHLPDHLWAAFVSKYFFGADRMPIASNFLETIAPYDPDIHDNIWSAQGTSVEKWYVSNNGHPLMNMFDDLQHDLYILFRDLFGESYVNDKDLVGCLPSGVMTVASLSKDGVFDYAWTGDVDTYEVSPKGFAVIRSYDDVDKHDAASRVVAGQDRKDRRFMQRVASTRVPEVGNLTGSRAINVLIHRGSFNIRTNGGAVISTDGERMVAPTYEFRGNRNLDPFHQDIQGEVSINGTLLFRDPGLYQVDQMNQQELYRGRGQRGRDQPLWYKDDSTFLRVRRTT